MLHNLVNFPNKPTATILEQSVITIEVIYRAEVILDFDIMLHNFGNELFLMKVKHFGIWQLAEIGLNDGNIPIYPVCEKNGANILFARSGFSPANGIDV